MLSMVRKFYTPQISYLCGKGGQQLFSIAIMSSSGFSTSRIADVNMGFESVKIKKKDVPHSYTVLSLMDIMDPVLAKLSFTLLLRRTHLFNASF